MRFLTTKWAIGLGAAVAIMPNFAYAEYLGGVTSLINNFVTLVNIAIPLAMALALLAFFWGLVKALWGGGNEAKSEGWTLVKWGIIILFVMAAIWGIVKFIAVNLGVELGGTANPPTVQTQNVY
jgi:hypothetical protein